MKIRNLPYDQLNGKEKKVVDNHYKVQMDDKRSGCRECNCAKGVREFWEIHRKEDTENGTYDGWVN